MKLTLILAAITICYLVESKACCKKQKKLTKKQLVKNSKRAGLKYRKGKLSKDEILKRKKLEAADLFFVTTKQAEYQYDESFAVWHDEYMYRQYANAMDLYNELRFKGYTLSLYNSFRCTSFTK